MEKIDLEYLQQLTYDRSTSWSAFFETKVNEETTSEPEINVLDAESFFIPEDGGSPNDSLSSMEDENYDDTMNPQILQNVSAMQFSLLTGSNAFDLTAVGNEDEKKFVDLFNKTQPIFSEHERQLKENGFDKVLLSFKKDDIDEKFGSWLNRHNSLFGGDNTLVFDRKSKEADNCGTKKIKQHVVSDSDDSIQSGETARYIRSSKVGSRRNYTTTMIKEYRMIKSMREALREKYACETDEDDFNMNALRHCKKLENANLQRRDEVTPFRGLSKNERLALTARTQRRKVLRKRGCSSSCIANYSSSESEYPCENHHKPYCRNLKEYFNQRYHFPKDCYNTPLNCGNKGFNTCSSVRMTSAVRNRMYYISRSHSMSFSSSPLSSSCNSASKKRRAIKRNTRNRNDERPCRRESDCCCKGRDLCKKYQHIAEQSTNDWYVDNASSAKKLMKTPVTKTKTQSKTQRSLSSATEKLQTAIKTKENDPKTKTYSKENKYKSKNDTESSTDESFNLKLQQALKVSKEIYEKEAKKRNEKPISNKVNKKCETNSKRKILKKKSEKEEKDELVSKGAKIKNYSGFIHTNESEKEETIFTPTHNRIICNSTALSTKGQAYKRQFAESHQTIEEVEEEEVASSQDKTVIELKKANTKSAKSSELLTKRQVNKRKCTEQKKYLEEDEDTESSDNKTIIDLYKGKTKPGKKLLTSTRIVEDKSQTTVTSTTLRSPEFNMSLSSVQTESNQKERKNSGKCDDHSDCSSNVTSTTNIVMPSVNTSKHDNNSNNEITSNKEITSNNTTTSNKSVASNNTTTSNNENISNNKTTSNNEMTANNTTTSNKATTSNNGTQKIFQHNLTSKSNENLTENGIRIYDPKNRKNQRSTNDGYFSITKDLLIPVIGEKATEKFFKYYIGPRRFNVNSTIYYQPPNNVSINLSSSSESADDLDNFGQFGSLYAITK